jgi:hypothetical protein
MRGCRDNILVGDFDAEIIIFEIDVNVSGQRLEPHAA